MTVKNINGTTITTGYVLSATYSALHIYKGAAVEGVNGPAGAYGVNVGTPGTMGGIGVLLNFAAVVQDYGTVDGGNGGAGGATNTTTSTHTATGGVGGSGNYGIWFADGGTLTVKGTLNGGSGGAGGKGRYGGNGGSGGAGLVASTAAVNAKVMSGGTVIGGAGGQGGGGADYYSGYGGNAGAGLDLSSGGFVGNYHGFIEGGQGGAGGATPLGIGRAGGAGGDAVALTTVQATIFSVSGGTILGGTGGVGGAGSGAAGVGGIGGDAIYVEDGGSITNYALMAGGIGGVGGAGDGEGAGANGGRGGAGIELSSGGVITNFGTISGGAGGGGGTGSANGAAGFRGDGIDLYPAGADRVINQAGALIVGYFGIDAIATGPATITNFGTIEGAAPLATVSVLMNSASDRLIVKSGSSFIGGVYGTHGGTLELASGADTISRLGAASYLGTLTGDTAMVFFGFSDFVIDSGAQLTLSGVDTLAASQSLTNAGSIALAAGAILNGYAGASLVNNGTITGGGSIYGPLGVTNAAGGVIDDNAGSMLINNQNGGGLANSGLIESAAGDTLTLKEVTVSGAGSIEAFGTIKLDAAAINGGTVNVETGGVLQVASTISSIGTGVTVDDAGSIRITSGAYLYLSSNIIGAGSISINGVTGTNADLKAVGNVTLSGGGQVSMNVNGFITGYGSSHLTNDDTITGGGAIFGSMTVTNGGVIDDDAGAMLINNQNGGGLINNDLIESTATGVLSLKEVTVNGSATIIDDHQLKLASASINGGTITVGASALFEVIAGTSSLGSAVTMTNDKTLEVITGGALTIAGLVANNGIMETVGTGDLTLSGAVAGTGSDRLTGSGNLTIDGTTNQGVAFASTATGDLVLGSSSTFTGTISGLSGSGANAIDLRGVAYNASDTAVFSGKTGTLTLYSSTDAVLATLKLKGNYNGSTFVLSNDGSGGTLIKDPPASGPMAQAMAGFGAATSSGGQATPSTAAPQSLSLAVRG